MLYIKAAALAGIVAALLLIGAKVGRTIDDDWCASKFPDRCSATVKAAIAQQQVVYRDKTIPILVHDTQQKALDEKKLVRDIQAINDTHDTGATCSATPAFVELRSQLALDNPPAP
jgi:hypothetical protein